MSYAGKCPECGFPFEDHEFACAECSTVFNPVAIMEGSAKRKSEAEKLRDEITELRARLAQAEECLKPFAAEGAEWCESELPNDYVPCFGDDASCGTCGESTGGLNDLHDASFDLGHLRAAAKYMEAQDD